jgi:hypothetical protein
VYWETGRTDDSKQRIQDEFDFLIYWPLKLLRNVAVRQRIVTVRLDMIRCINASDRIRGGLVKRVVMSSSRRHASIRNPMLSPVV